MVTPAGKFTCSICGESHEGAPLSWGPDAPDMWADLPPDGREERGELGSDQCVIDDKHFFVRGRIEIPVTDTGEDFAWLVWAEVSATDILDMASQWEMEGRESAAPYPARLANRLSLYSAPTLGLSVRLHTRAVGIRPLIEVIADHPLHKEQQNGISSHQVQQIAQRLLSGE